MPFGVLFFLLGQRPRQGTKSCSMGRNSICQYVRPSIRPLGIEGLPEGSKGLPEESQGQSEGSKGLPEMPEGLPGGPGGVRMYGRTYKQTDGRTEFLPILQDFVPCWGRCPATL